MTTLRILGLDDDNHSPYFRCENNTIFHSYRELITFLSKPHNYQIEVKMFAIVDEWTPALEELDEDKVDLYFNFLSDYADQPDDITFEEIFNLFWESANRLYW